METDERPIEGGGAGGAGSLLGSSVKKLPLQAGLLSIEK